MANLFVSAPGTVTSFQLDATVGTISVPAEIKDPVFITRPGPVIFSQVEWVQRTNQQFANSLDGSVYIYVFGDQMGSVRVNGLAMDALCGQKENGLQKVLKYYETNRASKRSTPIGISIADQIVRGFLTGVQVTSVGATTNPQAPVLHSYDMEINALP